MTRPPEHVDEPRPEAMAPLSRFRVAPVDELRLCRWLLGESIRRLRAARRLEVTRQIIYPETTSILRDCERLARRINILTGGNAASAGEVDKQDLAALLEKI